MIGAIDLNWPKKGDQAFAPVGGTLDDSELAAFVHPCPGAYTVGFKWAADKVIEAARQESRNPDLLFFPIAYLYRHFLELSLKDLVHLGVRSGTLSASGKLLEKHDLSQLWNAARQIIKAVWPNTDRTDTDAVEKVILEFHHLDESGQAFRYATTKSGDPHLIDAPPCVSLDSLKATMDRVANFLEAAEAGIDACDPGCGAGSMY